MASYLEIKQLLSDILDIDLDVDENCDIVWHAPLYFEESIEIFRIPIVIERIKFLKYQILDFSNFTGFTENTVQCNTEIVCQYFINQTGT